MPTMTTGAMCRLLRDEGFDNATPSRIRHAIEVGYLDRPARDDAGNFQFGRREVQQVRRYLANVPRPGRKSVTA